MYTCSFFQQVSCRPVLQDRWLDCDLDKKQFLPGFVGFGGGRYQCPGKWFALMEMHLFVAMVISLFDLELRDPMPQAVSENISAQSFLCPAACQGCVLLETTHIH